MYSIVKIIGLLSAFSALLYSCSQETSTEQATATDTAVAPATVVDYIEDSMAEAGGRNWDDTIKPVKSVYILSGQGAEVLEEMDYNSGHGTILPFAHSLDVIGVYPEWYKVRTYSRGEHYTFYIPQKATVAESPAAIRLVYSNFDVYLKGFSVSAMDYSQDESADTVQLVYRFESEGYDGPPAWVVKRDTMDLYEDYSSFSLPNKLRISTKRTGDLYRVSYAYMQSSYEAFDERSTKRSAAEQRSYDYQYFSTLSPYTVLTDSAGYYNLPGNFDESESKQHKAEYKQAFKKKFQLRDTTVYIPWEGDYDPDTIHAAFTKNKRLFQYSIGGFLYVRIERLSGSS